MSLNFLRKIVSGKRNRYTEDGFNLDLTYITPRIIASSYPASGIESTYRNKISDVAKFLKQRHPGAYKIYNLSGRTYSHDYFEGKVEDYNTWGDHHSPPLHVLVEIVESIYKFLTENKANVVLLHCNAGKGRTGTAISSALIFCGMIDNAEEAMRFYSFKRFAKGSGGVSQPCQMRYVKYFEEVAKKKVKSAPPKVFKQMIINAFPNVGGDAKPCVEFYQYHYQNLIYVAKVTSMGACGCGQDMHKICTQAKVCPNISVVMCDDIYVKIKHGKLICRFSFNTAFIGEKNKLKFTKKEMDPDSIQRDKSFPDNFEIIMYFSDACSQCNNQKPVEEYCHSCMSISKRAFSNWAKISVIVNSHTFPKPESGVAGSLSDYEEAKKTFIEECKKDNDYEFSDDEEDPMSEEGKEIRECGETKERMDYSPQCTPPLVATRSSQSPEAIAEKLVLPSDFHVGPPN